MLRIRALAADSACIISSTKGLRALLVLREPVPSAATHAMFDSAAVCERRSSKMKKIRQRTETDCGVACLAMLAGISWAEARKVLFGRWRRKNFYTEKEEMRAALRRFGIITAKRLVRCKDPRRLKRDALLNTNLLVDGNSHWAVWDAKRKKVLDPYYKRTRCFSCLVVLRREERIAK